MWYNSGLGPRLFYTRSGGSFFQAKTSIKLGNGRWVQPESLEDLYRQLPEVQDVFVHGDSQHSVLVAAISVAPGSRVSPDVLLAGFEALAESAKRLSHERICGVILSDRVFSRDNGLLNSTGKLHRRNLLDRFREACHSGERFLRMRRWLAHAVPQTLPEGPFHEANRPYLLTC